MILLILLSFALIGMAWLFLVKPGQKQTGDKPPDQTKGRTINKIDYNQPTTEQTKAGEQIKGRTDQSTSPANTPSQSVTITIARLNQISSGQNVNLRASLSNNVESGKCVATFTKSNSTPTTVTTDIAVNPTSYSCQPIDVSMDQLGSGTWSASVHVEKDGNIISNIASSTVVVQ